MRIITMFVLALLMSNAVYALEMVDKHGAYESRLMNGKIYNDRGQYSGMITSRGRMYDKDGNFIGQIRGQNILNSDGTPRAYIRDNKIYAPDGNYQGRLKH